MASEMEAKLVPLGATLDWDTNVNNATESIRAVKESGGGLIILTGAGMSVSSGVPVFRSNDGSMSADFLKFLGDYNTARKAAGLSEAKDWFNFSVPRMFREETEREAWAYWRWRMLRAKVQPAADYEQLMRLADYFGSDNVFVETSNCDLLHVAAGVPKDKVEEIHGSLGRVQCSALCTEEMWDVDDAFLTRLTAEPDWVPRCPKCKRACLRPNVMIFEDDKLVHTALLQQQENQRAFQSRFEQADGTCNWVVLEIGAGTVVPSIRYTSEGYATTAAAFIRVNPSASECANLEIATAADVHGKYFPLASTSAKALAAMADQLAL